MSRSALLSLPLLVLGACQGPGIDDGDGDSDTDAEMDTSAVCEATFSSSDPANGATGVSVGGALEVTFSGAVLRGDIDMGISGVQGTIALADDGMSATYTPAAALTPETAYTLNVVVCDVTSTVSFTTATGPLPESAIEDRTYVIDFDDVQWLQPPGAGLLAGNLDVEYILLHVPEVGASTISLTGSLGETGAGGVEQDQCLEPFDFGEQAFTSNPNFDLGPEDLTFETDDLVVTIYDAEISAVFEDGGDTLSDINIQGELDVRDFDQDCPSLFIVPCMPCSSDGANQCSTAQLAVDSADADDTIDFNPTLVPAPECN